MAPADLDTLSEPLARTPLYELHLELGARMVPFAGYEMPVQYPLGILGEHLHTRDRAGLFDVSHMGQLVLRGGPRGDLATALERLVPGDIASLKPGQQRYTQLLNRDGGIVDDLMVTRPADDGAALRLIVNAARKEADIAFLRAGLPDTFDVEMEETRALLALQGPAAAAVMARACAEAAALAFMTAIDTAFDGIPCRVSRSGYTGEDGFEVSVAAGDAMALARTLLSHPDVAPIGLGARDTLRLEAGLCLYGQDIDETTSPVEADLAWSIGRRRRTDGGFNGAARVLRELADGPARRRVGLVPDGRAPAREGTDIVSRKGRTIGAVTSGSFAPTYGGPLAMGYVEAPYADVGNEVDLMIRGTPRPARIVALPFVPHRYARRNKRN